MSCRMQHAVMPTRQTVLSRFKEQYAQEIRPKILPPSTRVDVMKLKQSPLTCMPRSHRTSELKFKKKTDKLNKISVLKIVVHKNPPRSPGKIRWSEGCQLGVKDSV